MNDTERLRQLGQGRTIASLCEAEDISRGEFDAWWKETAAARVPPMTGNIPAHVSAGVSIARDERGIPHITAENDRDLFFAFGYAMAQDRLFQLDYLRRKAHGRLSEVLGRDGLEMDTVARTVGLNRIAIAEWDRLRGVAGAGPMGSPGGMDVVVQPSRLQEVVVRPSRLHEQEAGGTPAPQGREDRAGETPAPQGSDVAATVTAFTAGVNACIEACGDHLPIEFDLLGYRPEPWSEVDCVAIECEFRWYLTGRFPVIVIPELARRALGAGPLFDEFVLGEADEESILHPGEYKPAAKHPLESVGQAIGDPEATTGSNNWVISGRRTTTGAPLLGSDPHIAFEAVSCWYQAHLSGGSYNVAGMAYAGIPAIMFGRTENVAWGITNNICSQRDLYQEQTDAEHPGCFLYDGQWESAREAVEVIKVRDAEPVTKTIRFSRNGPIVNEILPAPAGVVVQPSRLQEVVVRPSRLQEAGETPAPQSGADRAGGTPAPQSRAGGTPAPQGGGPVSLKWLGAHQGGWLTSLLAMDRAQSVEAFRQALRPWHVPTFCLVFADTAGKIGMQSSGRVPVRKQEERAYRPGWDPAHQWQGLIPFEEMPGVIEPARGWVGTANNRLAPNDYPHRLFGRWGSGWRARRIREMIEEKDKLSPDDLRDMHQDAVNLRAAAAVPHLVRVLESVKGGRETASGGVGEAIDFLESWDFRAEPDSVATTLFNVFYTHWARTVAEERFDADSVELLAKGCEGLAGRLLEADPAGWFAGDREEKIRAAFQTALDDLTARFGPDMSAWTWSRLHVMPLKHVLSSRGDLGQLLNHGGSPVRGDITTVCNTGSGVDWSAATGAGYRHIADLSLTPPVLHTIDAQSQSGHPGSSHYGDQFEDWVAGRYHEVPLDAAEAVKIAVKTLTLMPG